MGKMIEQYDNKNFYKPKEKYLGESTPGEVEMSRGLLHAYPYS